MKFFLQNWHYDKQNWTFLLLNICDCTSYLISHEIINPISSDPTDICNDPG